MTDTTEAPVPRPVSTRRPIPPSAALALLWIALMVFVGVFADLLRPYSIPSST